MYEITIMTLVDIMVCVFWFRSVCGPYFTRLGGKRPESKLKKQPIKWAKVNLDKDD